MNQEREAVARRWAWPKYRRGDLVEARLHNGAIRAGRIVHVETHHSIGEDQAPYHIYSFRWPESSRAQHLGDNNIIRVLPTPPSTHGEG